MPVSLLPVTKPTTTDEQAFLNTHPPASVWGEPSLAT